MAWQDEPILDAGNERTRPPEPDPAMVVAQIRRLVMAQPYAVLCTQGQSQPYGSLVAFAATDDLRYLLFATPSTTRKFRLLRECQRVALLIDNRSEGTKDIMALEALTATGRSSEVTKGPEFPYWSGLLIGRHPYLESFVLAPSVALIRLEIFRYLHVVRFQEVQEWLPASSS
ncbi:MAG: pyridoxamine 5'-phosphate oxidase family protein [Gammaproteobacteria bacterium]